MDVCAIFHPDHLYYRRHRNADYRHPQHVHLRCAHAGAVFFQHWDSVVRPSQAETSQKGGAGFVKKAALTLALLCVWLTPVAVDAKAQGKKRVAAESSTPMRIDSARAMQFGREIVAMGRRAPGSRGQKKQQAYL